MKRDILKVKRDCLFNKKYFSEYSGRKSMRPSSHRFNKLARDFTKLEHRIARRHLNKLSLEVDYAEDT